eukprot:1558493-Karenia_brevis.AAC.1
MSTGDAWKSAIVTAWSCEQRSVQLATFAATTLGISSSRTLSFSMRQSKVAFEKNRDDVFPITCSCFLFMVQLSAVDAYCTIQVAWLAHWQPAVYTLAMSQSSLAGLTSAFGVKA